MHVYICTFMSRPQVNLGVASLGVIHFVFKAGSLSCPIIRLNLRVSQPQGSVCLCLPITEKSAQFSML